MIKAGILGGGQLGRMLLQAAANYPVETFVMENDDECPAAHLCHHFTKGNITDFDAVYAFGKKVDVLTIEIENVNVEALEKLESEGVKVFPKPAALKIIKNKILQKEFYSSHQIPTAPYVITNSKAEAYAHKEFFPAVHKLASGGYDGRGVEILPNTLISEKGFEGSAVLEKMIDIEREISMIVAMDGNGTEAMYPPVDMVFDKKLNLLSYQLAPADLPEKIFWKVEAIALKVVKELQSPGIFAVEMFTDKEGNVWVNETAPRVHNSGHHSIEGNYSSQYDMLWRVMLGYPLGCTDTIMPAAIVNLIGEEGSGNAVYQGLEEILKIENAFVHIYGKKQSKPGRKMGHVTILSKDVQDLMYKVNLVKNGLKVCGNS